MNLLAVAAAFAAAATGIAQDQAAAPAAPSQPPQTQAPAPAPAPATAPAPAPAAGNVVQTPGGYMPATAFPNGAPTPGAPVTFVPNPQTPSQAFPPPPPRDHYPRCKPGQFDGCLQSGSGSERASHARRGGRTR